MDGVHIRHRGAQGKAVQVDPIKSKLKAPRTNLLKLKYDKLLSKFGFIFNLRRYIKARPSQVFIFKLALQFVVSGIEVVVFKLKSVRPIRTIQGENSADRLAVNPTGFRLLSK